MNRTLVRLLKRAAGIGSEAELARVLAEAAAAGQAPAASAELTALLSGLGGLLGRVDAAFDQFDRDLDLRTRSLELTSEELVGANERLRVDLATRNRVLEGLREAAARLLGAGRVGAVPGLSDVEGLSALLPVLIRQQEADHAALAESERKFVDLYQNTPVMLHASDAAGVLTSVNGYWLAQLGYRRGEAIGRNVTDFMTEASRRYALDAVLPDFRRTGFCKDVAYQLVKKDGAVLDVLLSAYAERSKDGAVARSLTAMVDVTERRRAENELKESEARLQRALEASRLALWDYDFGSGTVYLSEAWSEFLGGPAVPTVIGFDRLMAMVPDEERLPVWEAMLPVIKGTSPRYQVEHRVIKPDGGTIWVQSQGRVVERDADGRARRAVGTNRSITELKLAEEALQLAALVYQHSSEAMTVSDADNRIIAINPAFTALTGYTAEDVIGKNPRILSSGRHSREFYRTMWETLNATGRWQGEVWNRHKNGKLFAEALAINTIRHADGAVHRYVALFSDITEKKEAENLIWQQANFDALTQLPNRRMFRDRLDHDLKKCRRNGTALAILFLDLDRFKEVNDTLGHGQGDVLLIEAARRISECVREADIVARFGGDEFTIAVPDMVEEAFAQDVAQRILDTLATAFNLGDDKVFVTASIGITLYPHDGTEIEDLFKHADQALYAAKAAGRNRLSYFTPEMQVAALARMRLTNDLRVALAGGQFSLHFQPVLDMATGEVRKAEALLRWRHPERGMIGPSEFIPLAEVSGLIIDIGAWVFREVTRWVARWRAAGNGDFQVSINQSPREFQREGNTYSDWVAHLRAIGLPGQCIAVEITEGLLLDASPEVKRMLIELRDAGIEVALDDFGVGYSSLSYLKNLHIDYLKIDQSFTRNLAPGSSDMALSEAIIVMAHKLGLKVVAEGVETVQQRDLLREAGCDFAQGNLFAEPMPAERFEAYLAAHRRPVPAAFPSLAAGANDTRIASP